MGEANIHLSERVEYERRIRELQSTVERLEGENERLRIVYDFDPANGVYPDTPGFRVVMREAELEATVERLEGERDGAIRLAEKRQDERNRHREAVEASQARIAELEAALRYALGMLNAGDGASYDVRPILEAALPDTEGRECPFCHAQQAGIGDRCGNCHRALPDTEGPHRPNDGDDVPILCYVCGEVWPCPDTEGEQ